MNITTYIRKEDEHLWKSIPNKAEWLHEALNSRVPQNLSKPELKDLPADFKKLGIITADKLEELTYEDF